MGNKYTVKQFVQKNKESGSWPSTAATIYAMRNKQKMNPAFITVGRRVLIDEDRFWELMEAQGGREE